MLSIGLLAIVASVLGKAERQPPTPGKLLIRPSTLNPQRQPQPRAAKCKAPATPAIATRLFVVPRQSVPFAVQIG